MPEYPSVNSDTSLAYRAGLVQKLLEHNSSWWWGAKSWNAIIVIKHLLDDKIAYFDRHNPLWNAFESNLPLWLSVRPWLRLTPSVERAITKHFGIVNTPVKEFKL